MFFEILASGQCRLAASSCGRPVDKPDGTSSRAIYRYPARWNPYGDDDGVGVVEGVEVAREWDASNIGSTILNIQEQWEPVKTEYKALQQAAADFQDSLVGTPNGAIPRLAPFQDGIRGLRDFTYCDFVADGYKTAELSMCNNGLAGLTNTALFMFLASFFSFFIIDTMFFCEIRLGGVGSSSSPLLSHPTFRTENGPEGSIRSLSDLRRAASLSNFRPAGDPPRAPVVKVHEGRFSAEAIAAARAGGDAGQVAQAARAGARSDQVAVAVEMANRANYFEKDPNI